MIRFWLLCVFVGASRRAAGSHPLGHTILTCPVHLAHSDPWVTVCVSCPLLWTASLSPLVVSTHFVGGALTFCRRLVLVQFYLCQRGLGFLALSALHWLLFLLTLISLRRPPQASFCVLCTLFLRVSMLLAL